MVFLGYILPPENQKAYKNQIEISVQNNKQDLINRLGDLEEKPSVVLNTNPSVQDILQTPIKTLNDANEIKRLGWEEYVGLIENVLTQYQLPPTSANIEKASKSVQAFLPDINPELLLESSFNNRLENGQSGIRSVNSSNASVKSNTPSLQESLISEVKSAISSRSAKSNESISSVASVATTVLTGFDTLDMVKDYITENTLGLSSAEYKKIIEKIDVNKKIDQLKKAIEAGKTIIGARLNKPEYNELIINEGDLAYKTTYQTDGIRKLSTSQSSINKVYNANIGLLTNISGQGLKPKGMSALNGSANFGKYYLNLKSFRNGHLVLYRPKANTVLLSKRNISPTLSSIVKDMRAHNKFEIEEYEKLKPDEQKVVDHLINLLRMDTPATMKSTLADEVWQLKNRYEILIGEMRAGNDGVLVVQELKQVLKKLKENKVITKRKHDAIVTAISS